MPINVFMSVGRPHTAVQAAFVAALEANLAARDLRPRTVGRTDFTHGDPLKLVDTLMGRCAGTIVVALERVAIESGIDRPGSAEPKRLTNIALATPWNQIEAAFSYARGLPLLVIKDARVQGDGLLEKGYDWYVHSTLIHTDFFDTPEFQGTFTSWHRDVRKRAGWLGSRN